jgi:hypothetical protein
VGTVLGEAPGEHIEVTGVVGGAPKALQLLLHPGGAPARQQAGVQLQSCRRPPGPDTQMVNVFDVFVGLLGRQRQVMLDRGQPRLQRANRHVGRPIIRGDALDPLVWPHGRHRVAST